MNSWEVEIFLKLSHSEWMKYLKRLNQSENFNQIINYYIPRKLKRFIQLDRKILENKENDFIIVHTEEEFTEKCRENPGLKNIHYLIANQKNPNYLLWQNSSGSISKLNAYLAKQHGEEQSIDEKEIFEKNNEKILIISAEPGMGKSLILDHFTQNSSAENFFIKINLNTCTKTLNDLKKQKIKLQNGNELIDCVLKLFLSKDDDQEISLLKHLTQEGKLILMFDGLDEVNDYKEQIICLIGELNKPNYRIKKILITTRNHLRVELEDHFKTFSFNLNNFENEDQQNFLVKYWHSLNSSLEDEHLKISARDLIRHVKSSLTEKMSQLIGIPLQTKIIGDIYFVQVNTLHRESSSYFNISNIAELYNQFVESKVKIQYEEKLKFAIETDQDRFEKEKVEFYSDHIKLSSSILFENKEEFKEKDQKRIMKYGVIVAFTQSIPTFLHQSFAEFFLAKSCLQKLKEQNDKELEKVLLRDERYFLVRRFLNDLIEKQLCPIIEKQNRNESDLTKEIENCCRENLISLLKYFVEEKQINLKAQKNQCLIIASTNAHKDIVVYLIGKEIDVNQQDEDGDSALMWTSFKRHKEIAQILLRIKEINVNLQNTNGLSALYWASLEGHKEIVQMLLDHKDINVNQQDKDGHSALYWASREGHKEIVQMLLDHKDTNVNQQNKNGVSAIYWASRNGHKEIVRILLQNEKINVNQQDKWGDSALYWASREGHKEIVQMLLDHKEINISQQNENGESAMYWASSNEHNEIFNMLEEKMKKREIEDENESKKSAKKIKQN